MYACILDFECYLVHFISYFEIYCKWNLDHPDKSITKKAHHNESSKKKKDKDHHREKKNSNILQQPSLDNEIPKSSSPPKKPRLESQIKVHTPPPSKLSDDNVSNFLYCHLIYLSIHIEIDARISMFIIYIDEIKSS